MPQPPLRLLSSMAARELLAELTAEYARTCGKAVIAEAAGGVDVAKRVQAGETADVVVLANNVIDKLVMEGKLLAGSRVDIAKSGVAIAVRSGASKPDVSTEEAVKRAVRTAASLSYSTGPSGLYLEKLFARWGIHEEIASRVVVPPPGTPVGSLVASGAAELGFQQLSELHNLAGVEVIGPLPPTIQSITVFSGGVPVSSRAINDARALLAYLASPATAVTKQRHGMESA
jgi:molybdate transport system substrate-binding protein